MGYPGDLNEKNNSCLIWFGRHGRKSSPVFKRDIKKKQNFVRDSSVPLNNGSGQPNLTRAKPDGSQYPIKYIFFWYFIDLLNNVCFFFFEFFFF